MNTPSNTSRASCQPFEAPQVLIINSDSSARRWIEATVSTAGLCAIACDSASELLARCSNRMPACVILDVQLPDANGFDIQEQLSRAGSAILFLTSEPCIASCVRAIKAGAVDFLTLPCDAALLLHSIRNALQKAMHMRVRFRTLGELQCRYERLTQREREVCALVASGLLNKQVAERMAITEFTVQVHRGRVMKKMNARSVADLVRMTDTLRQPLASGVTCDQQEPSSWIS